MGDWWTPYLGIQFQRDGDCYDIVVRILAEVFGVHGLPPWTSWFDRASNPQWVPVLNTEPGDAVLFKLERHPSIRGLPMGIVRSEVHWSLCTHDTEIFHMTADRGTRIDDYAKPPWNKYLCGRYRHVDLMDRAAT